MQPRWAGAATTNFHTGRPPGFVPTAIVIHRSGGSLSALRNRFAGAGSLISAHYGVAHDGTAEQYVAETDTAFHAGVVVNPTWPGLRPRVNPNFYTIGVELEGVPGDECPAAQVAAAAHLLAEIARRWSIPLDRLHVVSHSAIRASANCPGPGAPVERILAAAAEAPETAPVTTDAMEFSPVSIDRTTLSLPPSQYYPVATKKDLIVLHFTAGASARSAIETWRSTPEHVATAYLVDPDGTTYEVFPPSCWAYHLGIKGGTPHEKRSIGIEIVNVGPLERAPGAGEALNWWPKNWCQRYCAADESSRYVEATYRGKRYFATFREEQVDAVGRLVRHLCDRFDLEPRVASREKRLECDPAVFAGFKGIATHVNFRSDKWDIGPAFDWDRLDL